MTNLILAAPVEQIASLRADILLIGLGFALGWIASRFA